MHPIRAFRSGPFQSSDLSSRIYPTEVLRRSTTPVLLAIRYIFFASSRRCVKKMLKDLFYAMAFFSLATSSPTLPATFPSPGSIRSASQMFHNYSICKFANLCSIIRGGDSETDADRQTIAAFSKLVRHSSYFITIESATAGNAGQDTR